MKYIYTLLLIGFISSCSNGESPRNDHPRMVEPIKDTTKIIKPKG